MFHKSWAPGHNSSDYPRFYTAAPGEVYGIKQYQSAYEPYIIFKKEGPPWYVLGFSCRAAAYHGGFHIVGAMSASWDMGETRRLVCMKCISPGCHFLSSQIIFWFTKAMCTKKPYADSRYAVHSIVMTFHLTCMGHLKRKSNRKIYQDFKEEICLR